MRQSRLSKLRAEETRIAELGAKLEGAIAAFSAMPGPFGATTPYHAAQTTRHRQFSGDSIFGNRPQPEDRLLRPYDRGTIIARTRVMIRNNPWLAAIFLAYVQEIGTPTYKSKASTPGKTESDLKYNDRRERLMERWARDCESDDDLSLDEVIEIWGYESLIAGEMYVVTLSTGELQLIASELCGSEKCGSDHLAGAVFSDGTPVPTGTREADGKLRQGRRIIGYRFAARDAETGAVQFTPEKSTLVRREHVYHLYDRDRIEQSSGVPKVCSTLIKYQDLYETTDARAQQVKNAACLSMWITKNMDPYGFAEAMKGAMRTGQTQDAIALKALAEQRSSYTELRAGAVYVGAVNEDVKLIEPKLNAGDWIDYYIGILQVCSALCDGMPVEVGIEGFRRSSYSSARATMNKWRRNVDRRRGRIELKFLNPIQVWQTRRFEAFGDIPKMDEAQVEECAWYWPAIPDIDGAKTAAQNALELANGSTTLQRVYGAKGLHADIEMKQYAVERGQLLKNLIEQGIVAGLEKKEAMAWALTQMPGGGEGIAAMIFQADKLDDEPPVPAAKK